MKAQITTQSIGGSEENSGKEELIQARAYKLYLERGQTPGHELEDWLQAEREVRESDESRNKSQSESPNARGVRPGNPQDFGRARGFNGGTSK